MSPAKSPHATKSGYVNVFAQSGPDARSPLARRCPRCDAAPGVQCHRTVKGTPAHVMPYVLKKPHRERRIRRAAA